MSNVGVVSPYPRRIDVKQPIASGTRAVRHMSRVCLTRRARCLRSCAYDARPCLVQCASETGLYCTSGCSSEQRHWTLHYHQQLSIHETTRRRSSMTEVSPHLFVD